MSRIIATLCAIFFSVSICAEQDATEALVAELAGAKAFQGKFTQVQYDEDNGVVVESRGHFKLLRPGFFSWEIESPDSQLIIADPQFIWHQDKDLETVTRRPVTDSEQMSPLQILAGNEELLRSSFTISTPGKHSYALVPRGIDPGFQRLAVTFGAGVFKQLEILDNLNQRIVIEFMNIDTQSVLKPEDFSFVPPEGSDLFYYDQ